MRDKAMYVIGRVVDVVREDQEVQAATEGRIYSGPAPEYNLPAPDTAAGRAIYERAVDLIGEPYSRAYAEEVRIMVRVAEAEAAQEARTAALGALRTARGMMQARYDDLRWCNKDDDCHIKAEGALLAIEDFDEAIRDAEAGADGSEGGTRT